MEDRVVDVVGDPARTADRNVGVTSAGGHVHRLIDDRLLFFTAVSDLCQRRLFGHLHHREDVNGAATVGGNVACGSHQDEDARSDHCPYPERHGPDQTDITV